MEKYGSSADVISLSEKMVGSKLYTLRAIIEERARKLDSNLDLEAFQVLTDALVRGKDGLLPLAMVLNLTGFHSEVWKMPNMPEREFLMRLGKREVGMDLLSMLKFI